MSPQNTPRKILRKPQVCEATGLSPVQVWRKAGNPDDDFPASMALGPNAVGWFEDEIAAWQESRPRGGCERKPGLEAHYERGPKNTAQSEDAA